MSTLVCGVDVGSTWTKAVALDDDANMVGKALVRTTMSFEQAAARALEQVAGTKRPSTLVATGYGRKNVAGADMVKTEIACHALGAYHHFPKPCRVVDIGGQDNKIITVGEGGAVMDFKMNRKCAAGTGAFVEEISRRLEIGLDRLEKLAEEADRDITLGSFCTVFSATEVIKLIREGERPENICRGIFNSVVSRIVEMGELGPSILLTGGVAAAFPIVAKLFRQKTQAELHIVPDAQFAGALGAALTALPDNARRRQARPEEAP